MLILIITASSSLPRPTLRPNRPSPDILLRSPARRRGDRTCKLQRSTPLHLLPHLWGRRRARQCVRPRSHPQDAFPRRLERARPPGPEAGNGRLANQCVTFQPSILTHNVSRLTSLLSLPHAAIGVLGGSVSSCHGLDATTAHPLGNPIGPNCYPHRLFAWLNDVFPHPANELTNGACECPI